MNQLPSMLRDELLHVAVVHFPIAFLALAGFCALVFLVSGRGFQTLLVALTLGVAIGWIAILTGGWAEDVVNRVICDPTVTHRHEDWADYTMWSATSAWLLAVGIAIKRLFGKARAPGFLPRAALAAMLVFSAGAVLWTGHLGASLVYQQGAAVYQPLPQCPEFSDP